MGDIALQLPGIYKSLNASSNIDAEYGPYVSIAAAIAAVPENKREAGRTVGIVEFGSVVEYWWRDGILDADLIKKIVSFDTISLIAANDPSVDIFTETYLTANYGSLKVGQIVENSQQLAQMTLTGWHISNKNGLAVATLDMDDVGIYSGLAGSETLDISTVNTADIIYLIKPTQQTSDNIYKITGGVENRIYNLFPNAVAVQVIHSASPASNDIVTDSASNEVLPFRFMPRSNVNYQWT